MLKEVRIQILVKSILKFNITLLPIDFVTERYARTLYQLHLVFTGQINIHYLLTIVPNIKLFMRPDIIGIWYRNPVIVFQFTYNTYNKKISWKMSDSKTSTYMRKKQEIFQLPHIGKSSIYIWYQYWFFIAYTNAFWLSSFRLIWQYSVFEISSETEEGLGFCISGSTLINHYYPNNIYVFIYSL